MTETTETPSDAPAQDQRTRDKNLVFDALAEAGIDAVVVCFDGCGDSGQIDAIDTFDADRNEIPLPSNRKVHLTSPIAGDPAVEMTLREAIETLAYDYLGMSWADNDGAFGKFVFSTLNRSITLEFNERFTDFCTHTEHRPCENSDAARVDAILERVVRPIQGISIYSTSSATFSCYTPEWWRVFARSEQF
jgi:hypothetical protein